MNSNGVYKIYERVFVSNASACRRGNDEIAVVHACKTPCHQRAVGYTGSLPKNHQYYLWLRQDNDLYLNIIDPPVPLFSNELFTVFLPFAREMWNAGKLLFIHCNKGESRAPSLALLFLSKQLQAISDVSYESARSEFLQLFPHYLPDKGIASYLSSNWRALDIF
jgi:hypothetical protein